MRNIFGWDLPPGVTHRMIEDQAASGPCAICGQNVDADECICPECPVCGGIGDPGCYKVKGQGWNHLKENHGLVRTEEQKFMLECAEREWEAESRVEDAYWSQYLKEEEEWLKNEHKS